MVSICIARRLVRLRAENNWRQKDLAAQLGVSRNAVGMWESGRRTPRQVIVCKIELLESKEAQK